MRKGLSPRVRPGRPLVLGKRAIIRRTLCDRLRGRRIIVGLLAGALGVMAYEGAVSGIATLLAPHWLVLGAGWGLAYALVMGRARWAWGLAYGAVLGLYNVGFAAVAAGGGVNGGHAPLALAAMFGGHLIFGTVVGAVNAWLQPQRPLPGKVIFLRDYERAPLRR